MAMRAADDGTTSPEVYRITINRVGAGARGELWRVEHAGIELIASTREPFFDACRALAALGITGMVEMWHAGAAFPSMRGDITRCATLTVLESAKSGPRLGRWQPFDAQRRAGMAIADSASHAREEISASPLPM